MGTQSSHPTRSSSFRVQTERVKALTLDKEAMAKAKVRIDGKKHKLMKDAASLTPNSSSTPSGVRVPGEADATLADIGLAAIRRGEVKGENLSSCVTWLDVGLWMLSLRSSLKPFTSHSFSLPTSHVSGPPVHCYQRGCLPPLWRRTR